MEDCRTFLNYINDNYRQVQKKLKILSGQRKIAFDEDAFHTSIIKCYEKIRKKGKMQDNSPYGIESYLIITYFNYLIDEKRSAKNSKRDHNVDDDTIGEVYESYCEKHLTSQKQKLVSDLYKDFSTLYIIKIVELNFDAEHLYLFRLKYLMPNMTYKMLQEKTGSKKVRQKVVEVKNWLKENLKKEDINDAFNDIYGDLI